MLELLQEDRPMASQQDVPCTGTCILLVESTRLWTWFLVGRYAGSLVQPTQRALLKEPRVQLEVLKATASALCMKIIACHAKQMAEMLLRIV